MQGIGSTQEGGWSIYDVIIANGRSNGEEKKGGSVEVKEGLWGNNLSSFAVVT